MLPVWVFEDDAETAVAIEAHDRSNDGGVADSAIGIEDAVNVTPLMRDGEFPEIPSHVSAIEFFEGHVVWVGAADAGDLGVENGLVDGGCEGLGHSDVGADPPAR
jgi:hypothetical protein